MPEKPRIVDYVEKVRLRACDLRPGMYVCELDRPWLETPFLLQGFEVENDADIEAVMQHCEYVYIDLMRTKVVRVTIDELPGSFINEKKRAFAEKDMKAADSTRQNTSKLIKSFIDEIRFGQSLDIQLAKNAVSDCVVNLTNNPEAMMFLTRMRNKGEGLNQHAFNVCVYSIVLGRLLGYDSTQLEQLGTCGLLHDMGKVTIADEILNKSGPLNDEETAILQTHTTAGRDILMSGRNIFSGTVDVAYGHHENIDGTGYPRGMQGHQLNINCKIVAVVDKYEAITSPKPYRPAGDHLSAVAILNQLARDNKIDSSLTLAFVSYLGIYPPGTIVELSSGEVAIVLESNPRQRLRPQVLVVRDADKAPTQRFVDMSEKTVDDNGRPFRIVTVRRPGDFGIDLSQYYDIIMQAFNS
ncbi:MAG: HD-GYP domain-containing protein [Proteobacteria bacterium]|nr:HD-GYP domain-containing protein [Pseudomonadota bacterium]